MDRDQETEAAARWAALEAHSERTRIGEDQEDREDAARLRRLARDASNAALGNDNGFD